MASYKIALKLHQDQYGSEDAKVKIRAMKKINFLTIKLY